ncbi:MAG: nuclear transport factor 2 family protein [Acidimicrobiia bacterium]|nr:nuclear transport factor 2 family protein [Acidimicrobiia bacterium]
MSGGGEHSRDEVEEAFRHYWRTGAAGEDWEAWADLFTDDAVYVEHVLGSMIGCAQIKRWITQIRAAYPELYTVYEWHMIDGDRVVFYMQSRRDNPEPGKPPIDSPGVSIIHYAGDGKWDFEEDFWAFPVAQKAQAAYIEARAKYDPDHSWKMTRQHWPDSPDWARGPEGGPRAR